MNKRIAIIMAAISRVLLIGIPIIIQAALIIIMVLKFSEYYIWFYAICAILSLFVVFHIINDESNPGYKIAWIVPILIFPIFGGLAYLVFGTNKSNKHIKNSVAKLNEICDKELVQDFSVKKEICEQDKSVANQFKYINDYGHFPVYNNTSSKYFTVGEEKFEALKEELKKAKHYIFLEYFIIQEGVMWDAILEILEEKAKEGVDIRLIYDDGGSLFTLPQKYTKILAKKGIKALAFNPFKPFLSVIMNNRDHRKIVVIDGYVAFTGGINLSDEYINLVPRFGHWKDTAIMIKGEAVWSFTIMFLTLWNSQWRTDEGYDQFKPHYYHREDFVGDGYVLPYADSPLDMEAVGETVYLNLITKAKDYIYINTPYLIIDNEMVTALCNAAKSGVDVRINTPHIADKKIVYEITKANCKPLVEAGVKIYEYTPGFLHAKSFVVDDKLASIGTINLDYRSLYLHFECAALLYNSKTVIDIRDDFKNTLKVSKLVTLKDLNEVSIKKKITRYLLKVFAPLM
ncbi:MAG: cardiolipin synthase [Oscillospiraceae bacterium]